MTKWVGIVISAIFLKKLFYFFTTGTLLFYIVSFETQVNAGDEELARKELISCQENVRKINSGRVYTLKEKYQISYKNVLRQSPVEQKMISAYLKELKTSLIRKGQSNPMKISSYKFETKNNQTLGYKVVVQSWDFSTEEATFFADKEGNLLFLHVNTLIPTKSWVCEKS